MKDKILRLNLFVGLFILAVSGILLYLQLPFMKTWFYCFAWWSFILVMDSLNFRLNRFSPLSESTKTFFYTAFVSVFVWLVFELFNLRLKNWHYHDLPSPFMERWLGYFIAFASVIPALQEISCFMQSFLEKKNPSLFRLKASPFFLKTSVFVGLFFIFLTIIWPQLFFPLVWLCFIFLLEPLNYWLNNETLLADLGKKNWTRVWSWILSGLVAGFFWELWNFFAGSHWEYSLPYLDFGRIFHMPIFGYTGFMPFALEVFVFYQLFTWVQKRLEKRYGVKAFFFILFLLFYLGCFYLIDSYTLIGS
jgi:hypothetical protein